ncbi:hypothetical protein FSP39_012504 [Pinctada imbricata]|uniref:Uncharacterized protein n=1 Tax=Pinctada imbricata TaxID=66713 RepID=A0AA88Y941_PINIB|nr:hypothetical protein FSP39_012504 [Pinctada imbricata]
MILVVCVTSFAGGKFIVPNTAFEIEDEGTFESLFHATMLRASSSLDSYESALLSSENILKVKVREKSDTQPIEVSKLHMPISLCTDLDRKFVEFVVDSNNNSSSNACLSSKTNAFDTLMQSQKKLHLPSKIMKVSMMGPEKLYNDIIDWIAPIDNGWTLDQKEIGSKIISTLRNALWYIDHAHEKFKERGCPLPDVYKAFQGYNNYKKLRHKQPIVTVMKLNELCNDLSACLSFPSMNSVQHKTLYVHLESLLSCLIKYRDRLQKDNERHKTDYHVRSEPSFQPEHDSACQYIPCVTNVDITYQLLDRTISLSEDYAYIDLCSFAPDDRLKRRAYIKDIRLSRPIMLYRLAYGGNVGTLNFVWTVPPDESPERSTQNARVIAEILQNVPKFSTRGMRQDFINKYNKYVKTPKSVLRHMYHELTETEMVANTQDQQEVNDRAAEILFSGDDTDLLFDLRTLNGNNTDTKFGEFFNEMGKYFEEKIMAVQERRHSDELYLPLSISVEDLREQIQKRVPQGTAIPSSETIRLQFMPHNPFQQTALKYTGRFNIKFRVQTRQARVSHQDGKYATMLFRYLKEFLVQYRQHALFVCMDDKAVVPIGEPGIPISTGVRGHNKVMAPASGPALVATDHDFHNAGIIPSVAFVSDIPVNPNDSFFQGKIYVTVKDKIFQHSTPFRHATELLRIIRNNYSDEGVDLDVPILCLMTDGGPDHRLTYETVKASLVLLFMQADLDMLIAIRTAPNQSWINPAERCMSILNLALQHCALARDEMPEQYEKMIKNKSTLNAIRNAAECNPGLKTAYAESMKGVLTTVKDRFQRMKLKGEPVKVYSGVKELLIEECLKMVTDVTGASAEKINLSACTKDIRDSKEFQEFVNMHCVSTHYSFQIMKCVGEMPCAYCAVHGVRLPSDVIESLSFLPCPVPDANGEHYKCFKELYGKEVDDTHRPSSTKSSDFGEDSQNADRTNRDLLKAPKARDIIKCGECQKPRLIYSSSKLSRDEENALRRLKEENSYTCGDEIDSSLGFVVRRCISCVSSVEIAYYSAHLKSYVPPVCVYCGSEDDLMDDNEEYIIQLYAHYSTIRPLCHACRGTGLEAKTWGRKFFKKS